MNKQDFDKLLSLQNKGCIITYAGSVVYLEGCNILGGAVYTELAEDEEPECYTEFSAGVFDVWNKVNDWSVL